MHKKVLILGGAGFIGSIIAGHLYNQGMAVTVIDGLLQDTGANVNNILTLEGKIEIIYSKIEEVPDLTGLLQEVELIVDCMAWTSHKSAFSNPLYDLELNCGSHLFFISKMGKFLKGKHVIFLSSRGVYGTPRAKRIDEEMPLQPNDIQGVHKLTAEHYFNIYSKLYNFNVLSLRIPNCFGRNQRREGSDIGLIGTMINNALSDNVIEVYGENRNRNLLFVKDLAEIVSLALQKEWSGYLPLNVAGESHKIIDIANLIIQTAGKGRVNVKALPEHIRQLDFGDGIIEEEKIKEFLGEIIYSDFEKALGITVDYFKENKV